MASTYRSISDEFADHDANGRRGSIFDSDSEDEEERNWKQFLHGVILASISGILFTANNFVINQSQVDVGDVVLVRTAVQMAVYVTILIAREESFLPSSTEQKLYTVLQGVTGSVCFICGLACVSFMDVPDALSIIFACPVVTILLSVIMLRDKLNIVKIIAGFLLLSGVILVCKPNFLFDIFTLLNISFDKIQTDEMFTIGVVLAVIACVSGGFMDVLIAKCISVSASVLILWTAVIGFLIAVTYGLLNPGSYILSINVVNIPARDWAIFFGLSISGLLAFFTLTKSLQMISPNLVASLRTLELVLAFSVQSLITGLAPDILSCVGGTFIFVGVLMLALQDQLLLARDLVVTALKKLLSTLVNKTGDGEYTRLLP